MATNAEFVHSSVLNHVSGYFLKEIVRERICVNVISLCIKMVLSSPIKPLIERLNLTIDQLDYKFIENCKNVKQLVKILRVLRSGEEGIYPHLIKFCETKLEEIDPNNSYLQAAKSIISYPELPEVDRKVIQSDIEEWSRDYSKEAFKNTPEAEREDIPPVRGKGITKMQLKEGESKNRKTCKPRSYEEWNKYDVEEELEKMDSKNTEKSEENNTQELLKLDKSLPVTGLSEPERKRIANLERIKGNEAFKAQDYEEAVLYYSRSLIAHRTAKTLNNRAQAHIKLKNHLAAVIDCNEVISLEPDNIKALFRRGIAHKEAEMFDMAIIDFEILLKLEPENKSAKDQLKQVEDMKFQKEHTRRKVVIEELESQILSDGENEDKPKASVNNEIIKKLAIEETTEITRPLLDEICNCQGNEDDIQPLSQKTKEMLTIFNSRVSTTPSVCSSTDELATAEKTKRREQYSSKILQLKSDSRISEKKTKSETDFAKSKIQNENVEKYEVHKNTSERTSNEKDSYSHYEVEKKSFRVTETLDLQLDREKSIHKPVDEIGHVSPSISRVPLKIRDCTDESSTKAILSQKVTPFEFLQVWLSNNCNVNSDKGAACLPAIKPQELPNILTNKVDGPLLKGLLMAIKKIAKLGKEKKAFDYMQFLLKVPRINIATLFLSNDEKEDIEDLLIALENKLKINLSQAREILLTQ